LKFLETASSKIETIQDELAHKNKENKKQQDDIDHLYAQVTRIKKALKNIFLFKLIKIFKSFKR
jgi:predicted  nucleic acid-binding Zn-ribbon protein